MPKDSASMCNSYKDRPSILELFDLFYGFCWFLVKCDRHTNTVGAPCRKKRWTCSTCTWDSGSSCEDPHSLKTLCVAWKTAYVNLKPFYTCHGSAGCDRLVNSSSTDKAVNREGGGGNSLFSNIRQCSNNLQVTQGMPKTKYRCTR